MSEEVKKFEVTEDSRKRISSNAERIFKSLFEDHDIGSAEDTVILLNSALCFMCMIQNSFYPYEARDGFADSVTDAMKKNKGPAPVAETPDSSEPVV